jgi:hypothetical protein
MLCLIGLRRERIQQLKINLRVLYGVCLASVMIPIIFRPKEVHYHTENIYQWKIVKQWLQAHGYLLKSMA